MASFNKHAGLGATIGGGTNLLWQLLKLYDSPNPPKDFWEALQKIRWEQVATFAVGGAAIASLPDILEPASSPNHRALFHGVGCATALGFGAFGQHTKTWTNEERHTAQTAALCYLSHLLLDASTPKGLPLIC